MSVSDLNSKKKIVGLNIVRVIAALGTFLYHTYHNFDCRYGIADYYIMQSTFHMTTFFVLSGFVIFYTYNEYSFEDSSGLCNYIKKRFLSIFPEYFLIYTIWYYIGRSVTTLEEDIIALPFQITMTFGFEYYPHLINWGAWFFSLIFLCYFFSPYLIMLIKRINKRIIYSSAILAVIFISFAPWLYVMVYNNFFFRFFEFYVGMVLAYLYIEYDKSIFYKLKEKTIIFIVGALYIISFIVVSYAMFKISLLGLNHTFLSAINIILVGMIIYIIAHADGGITYKVCNNFLTAMLAKYSLEIYVGTFLSNHIYILFFQGKYTGIRLILLAFFLNLISTCLLGIYKHYIQLLIRKNECAYFAFAISAFLIVAFIKVIGL